MRLLIKYSHCYLVYKTFMKCHLICCSLDSGVLTCWTALVVEVIVVLLVVLVVQFLQSFDF